MLDFLYVGAISTKRHQEVAKAAWSMAKPSLQIMPHCIVELHFPGHGVWFQRSQIIENGETRPPVNGKVAAWNGHNTAIAL